MDTDLMLYHRRWDLAYQQVAGTRGGPNAESSRYSTSTPRVFTRRNGVKFTLDAKHTLTWGVLVKNAYDLTMSVTHTMLGLERLSQQVGMVATDMRARLRDLEDIGLVRRTRRFNQSSRIYIHLVPLAEGQEDPLALPVSLAGVDMGYYEVKGLRAGDASAGAPEEGGRRSVYRGASGSSGGRSPLLLSRPSKPGPRYREIKNHEAAPKESYGLPGYRRFGEELS